MPEHFVRTGALDLQIQRRSDREPAPARKLKTAVRHVVGPDGEGLRTGAHLGGHAVDRNVKLALFRLAGMRSTFFGHGIPLSPAAQNTM
jgi:hypothetical protein